MRKLYDPLLAEFHVRLHSHAPENLIKHCTRRNSAWYIAKTSEIAAVVGWLFGILIISKSTFYTCFHPIGFVGTGIAVVIFFLTLSLIGDRWNKEFWEVAWKWITWDICVHPLSQVWIDSLGLEKRLPKCA